MSTKVACRNDLLKRRVDDFFRSDGERKAARELIISLAGDAHAWIFGGMIRDLGLFGRRGFCSDIDVVIDCEPDALLHCLRRTWHITDYSVNKMGGIRFRYQNIDFDIWCLADTWAFKQNLIHLEDEQSLLKTTLMTWDAVLYSLQSRKLISQTNYVDDLVDGRLELVLTNTPNESGALIKILRTIYNKRVDSLGPRLCHFLYDTLPHYSYDALNQYEVEHYRTLSFSASELEYLRVSIRNMTPGASLKVPSRQLAFWSSIE